MTWNDGIEKLEPVIPLKGNVLTVTYSHEPAKNGIEKPMSACTALQEGRKEVLNINEKNSTCFGGKLYLGFLERPREGHENFLANIEHIFSSIPTARSFFNSSPPLPKGLTKFVILAPLEKTEWRPDLVLFVGNPCQISRLLGIASYNIGKILKVTGFTAACHAAIGIPISTGEIDAAFIDYPARERANFADNEMIISFPYRYFRSLVENVEKSRCGTKKIGEVHF